jgi:hypothetical protein
VGNLVIHKKLFVPEPGATLERSLKA